MTNKWARSHTLGVLVFLLLAVVCGAGCAYLNKGILAWLGQLACLTVMCIVIGLGITGRAGGILINEQFRFSLSRLQILLWSLLIMPAISTVGYVRLLSPTDPDSLNTYLRQVYQNKKPINAQTNPQTKTVLENLPIQQVVAELKAIAAREVAETKAAYDKIPADEANKIEKAAAKLAYDKAQKEADDLLIISADAEARDKGLQDRESARAKPLEFEIPSELWVLMGISLTSAVASPLILGTKRDKEPNPLATESVFVLEQETIEKENNLRARQATANQDMLTAELALTNAASDESHAKQQVARAKNEVAAADGALARFNATVRNLTVYGDLVGGKSYSDARFSNFLEGEEADDNGKVNFTRVQNLFFTLVLVATYGAVLFKMFQNPTLITALPKMDTGMITLLGISHAGYLMSKATPTPTTPAI